MERLFHGLGEEEKEQMTLEKQIGFYDDQRHRRMNDSRERLGMLKDAYKP